MTHLIHRAVEFDAIDVLSSTSRRALVHGPAGVGKTHLLRAWRSARRDVIHLDLYDPGRPYALLGQELDLNLERLSAQARAHYVSEHLEELGVRVIIADADTLTTADVDAWTPLLDANASLSVIFAARAAPSLHIPTLVVEPLPLQDARSMYEACLDARGHTLSSDPSMLLEQLDGLPLAIELAAELANIFSPDQLATRLAATLAPLDTPHRSLHGALQNCWKSLAPSSQEILLQLAWIPGPFTVAFAERYCGADEEPVWRIIQTLLRHSLLHPTTPDALGTPRVRMLESVRTFTRDIQPPSVLAREFERMSACIMTNAREIDARLQSLQSTPGQRILIEDLPVFSSFIEVCPPEHDGYAHACLILGFAATRQHLPTREVLAQLALARTEDPWLRGRLDIYITFLEFEHLTPTRRLQRLDALVTHATSHDLPILESHAHRMRAEHLCRAFETGASERAYERAISCARRGGDSLTLVLAVQSQAWLYGLLDRVDETKASLREALSLCQDAGDVVRASIIHKRLADALLSRGLSEEALHHIKATEAPATRLYVLEASLLETRTLYDLQLGRVELALEKIESILEIDGQQGNTYNVISWRKVLSGIHAQRGNWELAKAQLHEALWVVETQTAMNEEGQNVLLMLSIAALVDGDRAVSSTYRDRAAAEDWEPIGTQEVFSRIQRAWIQGLPPHDALDDSDAQAHGPCLALWRAVEEDPETFQELSARATRWLELHPGTSSPRWFFALAHWWRERLDAPEHVRIDHERAQVWVPGRSKPIDLSRRAPLRRVMFALATLHAQDPHATLSVWDAFEAGWPDELIDVEQMSHRVRVVISRLRKAGLQDHILTFDQGYRWSPTPPTRARPAQAAQT